MKFSIETGNPSPEELAVLQEILKNYKPVELKPVIKRSLFGLPQLREPLPHQITFGARRFE